ncbi:hypothetical protein [Rhizobium sp. MHM7A]|uniref:hypothetical protein n=1 Tax=Rhizobium sp. MHM7A TaxID=2583233 RepID=UPI0011071C7F|nr:hypothetical protein [Rhizobium sp. MHM7A]TLX16096.1 hypothetical protein FFR93_01880 [Rhizobium sp. MHM7A]
MFIPKLNEEEARFLTLRYLTTAPKNQGTVEEIRHSIQATRQMGDDDLRPNPTRSNAPFWHQIVQNSTDRIIIPRGYVDVISPPPNKIVRLTEGGCRFLKPYVEMFESHPDLATYTFFDNSILEDLFSRNKAIFTKSRIRSSERLCDFIKSKRSAQLISQAMEDQGYAATFLDGLEGTYSSASKDPTDEATFRVRQIRAWRQIRTSFDPITEALADFTSLVNTP